MSPLALRARGQRGLSLVELLVGLTLGLTVIAAALALYLSSGHALRSTQATTQMTEDASVALAILRAQIALAGYSNPSGLDSQGQMTRAFTGQGLFGCTGGITHQHRTPAVARHRVLRTTLTKPMPSSCATRPTRATPWPRRRARPPTAWATARPWSMAPTIWPTTATSSTTTPCPAGGNGHSVSQPLVDHIVDLDLRYGIATSAASAPDDVTLRYLTAQEVSGSAAPPSTSPLWRQVKAVRLCLVLRSELEVQDSAMTYTNCQGLTQAAPDRRLYRAFHTTVKPAQPAVTHA